MTRRKIMNEQQKVELKLIHMEDVVSKEVEWLWYPYIPYGKITIVEGDPREGKTTLVLKLAAALSGGLPLPCDDDREREPIHIIYQTAEDGIDDTIKPRLEKAGADCSMIRVIDETEKELSMIDDRLEQAIVETRARLVILDPIQAYIGAKVDMHRANEIRPVLKHLGMIAEKYNCAIVLIGHMNKAAGSSPHMHIVGVPVADGYKKGLSKQVSKRKVFTKEVLSRLLQDELREVANKEVNDWFGEQIKEKSKGRNHDLTVAEYKVAQETEHLEQIQEQVSDADIKLFASQIAYKELERRQTKELNEKRSELQSVRQEIASVTDKANEAVEMLDKINAFVSSFRLFAPTIEEYANHVEADKIIEAGNSFRGIFYEIGKLLETFKELIKEGLYWFPRLMRWKTSKGEVAPVFIEKSNGYSYSVYGYMNVETREYYSKETIQWEIRKMINISRRQIINNMKYTIIIPDQVQVSNILREVFNVANSIEVLTGIRGILTSNKLWELLVACKLGHRINPEQRKHDAYDQQGRTYEYKVTKKYAWKFQDISENVLESYIQDEKIILAVVDKKEFIVEAIYVCDPRAIVKILRNKLCLLFEQKEDVRRLAATINIGDVRKLIDRGEARCLR